MNDKDPRLVELFQVCDALKLDKTGNEARANSTFSGPAFGMKAPKTGPMAKLKSKLMKKL